MKKSIFVTGTDTGIGKTVITGLLARYLLENGENIITQKWVQTGSTGLPTDIKTHLMLIGKNKNYLQGHFNRVAPYVFRYPASPHLAAKLENKKIKTGKIIADFKNLSAKFDRVIVEGAGGVLVPINERELLIDLAGKLKLGVLLVAGNRLGAINHTLLSIEALKARRLNILGVVFNNLSSKDRMILEDNYKTVKRISGVKVFGPLLWSGNKEILYENFRSFAGNIIREADRG